MEAVWKPYRHWYKYPPRNENPINYDPSHVSRLGSDVYENLISKKKSYQQIVVFQNLGCSVSGFSLRIMLLSIDLQDGIQPKPAAFGRLPVLWQCICPGSDV